MSKVFTNVSLLLCLILPGCRYHTGYPVANTSIKTICVLPTKTEAIVPQMSALLTRQIRENLIRNGIALGAEDTADAVLEMSITTYGRSVGSVDEADTDVAKTLSLNASVKCSLRNRLAGDYYFKNQSLSASLSINANTSAQAIEYQRLPQLTEKLAQKVSTLIFNIDNKPLIK